MSEQEEKSKKVEYVNYIEPFIGRFRDTYSRKSWKTPLIQAAIIVILAVAVSFAILLLNISLPTFVTVPVGVVLGIIAYIPARFAASRFAEEKEEANPDYLSLKERLYPAQRMRYALITVAVLILLAAGLFNSLNLTGGVIVVMAALGAYDFLSRTSEEFDTYIEGEEIDPAKEAKEAKEAEKKRRESRELLEKLKENSADLSVEEQKILLRSIQNRQINIEEGK